MKKLFSLTLLMLLGATTIFAQGMGKEKQRASPHETVTGTNVKVTYGRPYKKGREIFGTLEAYGKVWRLGADEATEITFDKGVVFGGKQVSAGTYTMFAIPEKTEWTIILNKQLKQWGAFSYDQTKDLVRIKVMPKTLSNVVEQLTITPKENELVIEWAKTNITIPMKF